MPDVFTIAKRSEVMSRIRSRGNKGTELVLMKIFRAHRITGWRRHALLKFNVQSLKFKVGDRRQVSGLKFNVQSLGKAKQGHPPSAILASATLRSVRSFAANSSPSSRPSRDKIRKPVEGGSRGMVVPPTGLRPWLCFEFGDDIFIGNERQD